MRSAADGRGDVVVPRVRPRWGRRRAVAVSEAGPGYAKGASPNLSVREGPFMRADVVDTGGGGR